MKGEGDVGRLVDLPKRLDRTEVDTLRRVSSILSKLSGMANSFVLVPSSSRSGPPPSTFDRHKSKSRGLFPTDHEVHSHRSRQLGARLEVC